MPQHAAGRPSPQDFDVVDAVAASEHGVDQGEQLAPGAGRTWPAAEIDQLVGDLLDPSRWARVAGSSPALATARGSSKAISTWSKATWEDGIEKVSSDSGILTAWQPSFSLVRRPFLPGQEALFRIQPRSSHHRSGGTSFRLRGGQRRDVTVAVGEQAQVGTGGSRRPRAGTGSGRGPRRSSPPGPPAGDPRPTPRSPAPRFRP
jgi:hypothetical protein